MKVTDKLQTIFAHICDVNAEPTSQPGLNAERIIETLQNLAVPPLHELLELYQWHNGIEHLDAFLHLLSLEGAATCYKNFEDLKAEMPDFPWYEGLFPILDMNGDVQICLNLKTFELFSIDVECDSLVKIADHYERYLEAILHIFESQMYRFNEEAGCIKVKETDWEQVQQQFEIKGAW
jgi:hypothetical protein